jgi:hypothetical protein
MVGRNHWLNPDSSYSGNAYSDCGECDVPRTTDLFIQQKLKKNSLDVGADRIARTA